MEPWIRFEQPADIASIRALHEAAFPSAAEGRLVDLLRTAGRLTVSVVADDDGRVVGHVALSPVTVDSGEIGLGLAPVAVQKAFRRRGIAGRLVTAALAAGRDAGYGWAVLLGDPAYYARFGFRPAPQFGLRDEYGGGDAFQALELIPESLPHQAGLVRYAPEFAVFA